MTSNQGLPKPAAKRDGRTNNPKGLSSPRYDGPTHTPGPWTAGGSMNTAVSLPDGSVWTEMRPAKWTRETHGKGNAAANGKLMASAPSLLAALKGLLAQLEGPVMIHGNGIGNSGIKDGLSGDEFQALKRARLEAARAAIESAGG